MIISVPADKLFWSRVPAVAASRQARIFRLERVVPMSEERLQISEVRLKNNEWLLMAMTSNDLKSLLDNHAGVLLVIPERIPEHLHVTETVDLNRLNLLVGPFEPASVARQRNKCHKIVVVGLLITTVIIATGLSYRWLTFSAATERAVVQQRASLSEAVKDVPGTAPAEARLEMVVRQREAMAAAHAQVQQEAWEVMQVVLAAWPADVAVQIEMLTATADRCVIRGVVDNLSSADRLSQALGAGLMTGDGPLRLEPLQVERHGDRMAIALTLMVAK